MNRDQYLDRMLKRILGESVAKDMLAKGVLSDIGPAVDLGRGEVGAVSMTSPKTASLFFDKVWRIGNWPHDVPDDIRFSEVRHRRRWKKFVSTLWWPPSLRF